MVEMFGLKFYNTLKMFCPLHPISVWYIYIFLHVCLGSLLRDLRFLQNQGSIFSCYLTSILLSIPIPYYSGTVFPEPDLGVQEISNAGDGSAYS